MARIDVPDPVEGWNPLPDDPESMVWWDGDRWTHRANLHHDRWTVAPLPPGHDGRASRPAFIAWLCALASILVVNLATAVWAQYYHPGEPACVAMEWQGSLRPYGWLVWLTTWAALIAAALIGYRALRRARPPAPWRTKGGCLGWFAVVVVPPAWWALTWFYLTIGCYGID